MTSSEDSLASDGEGALRAPDFFIVGQPKSGTTALYETLRRHPELFMSDLKEPMFMASDLLAGVTRPAVRARPQSLDQYLALFAGATDEQRVGEASALYLCSREAAANIARLSPAARSIAIMREPVSFLRSLHLQLLQDHSENEPDLVKALELEDARRSGKQIPPGCPRPAALFYSDYLRYVEQLRRFDAAFPPGQMLVLIYEDYRAENEATVRRVLRFLDVDDSCAIEVKDANPSVRLRSAQLDNAIKAVARGRGPIMRAVSTPVKALTSRGVRHRALRVARRRFIYSEPRSPDERLMQELRGRFKAEVVALGEYLDRDLVSVWGYDSVN
jgi:Sulfotransferase family